MNKSAFVALVVVGCKTSSGAPGQKPADLTVTSSAFSSGSNIPADFTCDGSDRTPPLTWTAMPETARSIAVIVDDPDASGGTFTHWLLCNVKPDTRALGGTDVGFEGGMSGTNDFARTGYRGPCPPKGETHHYHFRVYGLDTGLSLERNARRADFDKAMNGHVIAQGDLVGTFQH